MGLRACIWSGLTATVPSSPFIRTACSVQREPWEEKREEGRSRDEKKETMDVTHNVLHTVDAKLRWIIRRMFDSGT